MKKLDHIIRYELTLLLAIAAFLFWAFPYRAALSYQEQFQLFLTDFGYFSGLISRPGGLAVYVAEWLVQFYNNFWIGASLQALVFVALQLLSWRLLAHLSPSDPGSGAYALTFVPVVALWLYMGDTNVMTAFMVSLLLSLLMAWIFTLLRAPLARVIYAFVGVPAAYWLLRPSSLVFVLIMCVAVLRRAASPLLRTIWCVALVVYLASVVLALHASVRYPLMAQVVGIGYYRVPGEVPLLQYAVMLLFVAVVSVSLIPAVGASKFMASWRGAVCVVALTVVAMACAFGSFYDQRTYELVDYDYLVRTNQWRAIINKAERQPSDMPMGVCATDLALGMEGQLDSRAFDFFQHGTEGMLPAFRKEPNSSMMSGEVFFQLGLVNTAQRFYFEAMEAIPDFNKSSRCIKRLAETNMVRGDYQVAKKYLRLLQRTTFYKKWAQRMLELIDEPGAIDRHPLYGRLRHGQIHDDFLFSDIEMDKIIGQLYVADPSNRLARQYLVLFPLLQCDLDKFMQYMQVVRQHDPGCNPPLAQQAALLAYVKAGRDLPDGLAEQYTVQRFKDFVQIYTREGKDSPSLEKYKNTAWYYLIKGNADEK